MLKENFSYQEGLYAGNTIIKHIESTVYKTIDEAIRVKAELISNFEKEFGYSREDESFPDSNYSYNCGILDKLLKHHEQQKK